MNQNPWEEAGRRILAMLEDQYTITDREMCNKVALELKAVIDSEPQRSLF